ARVGRLFSTFQTVAPTASIVGGGPFPSSSPLVLLPELAPFPNVVPGVLPVQLPMGTTRVLPPGSYGPLAVGQNASLILRGLSSGSGAGAYAVESLRLGFNAQVIADNPVVMNVAERIAVGGLGRIGPSSATGL